AGRRSRPCLDQWQASHHRLRGKAPDRYASAIISSSQASRSAGVARSPVVSFCWSLAAQLPQSVPFSSAIALAPEGEGPGRSCQSLYLSSPASWFRRWFAAAKLPSLYFCMTSDSALLSCWLVASSGLLALTWADSRVILV